ncbi:hypothetical protein QU38_01035 [Staphylococcus aureus]|uniref:Uncharacterized protein n=1 Tax=Staphylococcus aureus TaxID=1280 RepID=A0AA40JPY2_STAAU|nr:hypothetical protein QU38_01035 [Staphylococcus aureus]
MAVLAPRDRRSECVNPVALGDGPQVAGLRGDAMVELLFQRLVRYQIDDSAEHDRGDAEQDAGERGEPEGGPGQMQFHSVRIV